MPDPTLNAFEQSCLTGPPSPWLIRATASLKDRLRLDLFRAVAIVYRRAEALGLCTSTACDACAQGAVGLHYGPDRADGRPGPQCQEGRLYTFPCCAPVAPPCATCGGSGEVETRTGLGPDGPETLPCPACTQAKTLGQEGHP